MGNVNGVICIYKQGNAVFHLLLISIVKLIKGFHLGNIAGRNTNHLTLIHTICKYKLQRTAHIKECCVMPAFSLAGLLGLNASDDIVLTGICQGKSSVLQCRDDYLVIVICRKSNTGSGQLCCLDQKIMR